MAGGRAVAVSGCCERLLCQHLRQKISRAFPRVIAVRHDVRTSATGYTTARMTAHPLMNSKT